MTTYRMKVWQRRRSQRPQDRLQVPGLASFLLLEDQKGDFFMDYSIRVYKVDKEDSRLRGFVSITFDGAFCAKSIALKQSANGSLYLEMPKYLDYESILWF